MRDNQSMARLVAKGTGLSPNLGCVNTNIFDSKQWFYWLLENAPPPVVAN